MNVNIKGFKLLQAGTSQIKYVFHQLYDLWFCIYWYRFSYCSNVIFFLPGLILYGVYYAPGSSNGLFTPLLASTDAALVSRALGAIALSEGLYCGNNAYHRHTALPTSSAPPPPKHPRDLVRGLRHNIPRPSSSKARIRKLDYSTWASRGRVNFGF